jgi:hypothetical protein
VAVSGETVRTSVLGLVTDFKCSRVLSFARMVGCHELEYRNMLITIGFFETLFSVSFLLISLPCIVSQVLYEDFVCHQSHQYIADCECILEDKT